MEKDRTKIVPTGVGMNNREGGLVKMARTGPDMSAFFSVLKAVSQSSGQRNGVPDVSSFSVENLCLQNYE